MRLVDRVEVAGEDLLELDRALRHVDAVGDRDVGPVGVEGADDVVLGSDHVVVEVRGDALPLGLGQGVDVLGGADEPDLLRSPEAQAHLVVDLVRLLGERLGDGEQAGDAGGVVVDPRALGDAVEVRAHHLHVVRVAGSGLGDDVPRLDVLEGRLHREVGEHRCVPGGEDLLAQRVALGELQRCTGDVALDAVADGAVERTLGVVVDDDRGGARLGGRGDLLAEGADAALHEDDGPGVHIAVVARLAAELAAGLVAVGVVGGQGDRGVGERRLGALGVGQRRERLLRLALHAEGDLAERLGRNGELVPLDL